jgi:hypothetical protein
MAQSEHSIGAIVTPKLNHRARDRFLFWIQISFCFVFISCSVQAKIPTAVDDRIEDLLLTEAARILAVSEDRDNFSQYRFFLSEFPRQDLLGISVGDRQIYISYKLASRALTDSSQRWLLRQTVAHEIAHETAGHAKQEGAMWLNAGTFTRAASGRTVGLPWYVRLYNYSVEKELEADLKGWATGINSGGIAKSGCAFWKISKSKTIAVIGFTPRTDGCSKPRMPAGFNGTTDRRRKIL